MTRPNLPSFFKKLVRTLIVRSVASTIYERSFEYRRILSALQIHDGELILDVASGSGTGLHYVWVHRPAVQPIAVDIDVSAMRVASKRYNEIQFVAATAVALPFRKGSFHLIMCSSGLEHFDDDNTSLTEICRCLKQNGLTVLTTDSCKWRQLGTWQAKHSEVAFVKRYYSRITLDKALLDAGLVPMGTEYLHTSWIAEYFVKLGVKHRYEGWSYLLLSIAGLFLTQTLGRLAKQHDGFGLPATARPKSSHLSRKDSLSS